MSTKTGIQWTDATWNPIRGCSRVSAGCQHCYAEAVAARFSGPGQPYEGLARRRSNGEPQWTGDVRVIESHMLDPIRWRKPRRIFVNSMSDLFHENVADETIDRAFAVMALAMRHTFQVLTKRPARMLEYVTAPGLRERIAGQGNAIMRIEPRVRGVDDGLVCCFTWRTCDSLDPGPWANRLSGIPDGRWPLPNVWLGVSVEDQDAANERIPVLADTPAAVRFLSCEPLLGPIDFYECGSRGGEDGDPFAFSALTGTTGAEPRIPGIDWVIVGGESGTGARDCRMDWINSIVAQCRSADVACFVKQLGRLPVVSDEHGNDAVVRLRDSHGADTDEWPTHLRVREFPAVRS